MVVVAAFWARSAARNPGQVREIHDHRRPVCLLARPNRGPEGRPRPNHLHREDIAHSFTVDVPYRISKRAGAGQSVVFEFRADETGPFPFYCNLTQDERCKQMKGELVVR